MGNDISIPDQIRERFSSRELECMRAKFELLSKEGSYRGKTFGVKTFKRYYLPHNPEVAEIIFNAFDESGNGKCSLQEFISALSHCTRGTTKEKYLFLFSMFDRKKIGQISAKEFKKTISGDFFIEPGFDYDFEKKNEKSVRIERRTAEVFRSFAGGRKVLTKNEFLAWAPASYEIDALLRLFKKIDNNITNEAEKSYASVVTSTRLTHVGADGIDHIPEYWLTLFREEAGATEEELKDPAVVMMLMGLVAEKLGNKEIAYPTSSTPQGHLSTSVPQRQPVASTPTSIPASTATTVPTPAYLIPTTSTPAYLTSTAPVTSAPVTQIPAYLTSAAAAAPVTQIPAYLVSTTSTTPVVTTPPAYATATVATTPPAYATVPTAPYIANQTKATSITSVAPVEQKIAGGLLSDIQSGTKLNHTKVNTTAPKQSPTNSLFAEIQGGAKLKHAEVNTTPPKQSPTNSLFAEIQGGAKLKHTEVNTTPPKQSPANSLFAEIQGGAKLKHTEVNATPPKHTPTNSLFAEIQGGAKLKHVDPSELEKLPADKRDGLTSVLARAMEEHRMKMRMDLEDEDDDDDDWE